MAVPLPSSFRRITACSTICHSTFLSWESTNVCVAGQLFGFPIVMTPSGHGTSQLEIGISAHRPCSDLSAPKTTIIKPLSPLHQNATLSMNLGMSRIEGIYFCHRTFATMTLTEQAFSKLTYLLSLISLSYFRSPEQVLEACFLIGAANESRNAPLNPNDGPDIGRIKLPDLNWTPKESWQQHYPFL